MSAETLFEAEPTGLLQQLTYWEGEWKRLLSAKEKAVAEHDIGFDFRSPIVARMKIISLRAQVRARMVSELAHWRYMRDTAGTRFIEQEKPRPVILFNQDFLDSQLAWGKVSALEAQLAMFDREHGKD